MVDPGHPHFRRRRGGIEWQLGAVELRLVEDLRTGLEEVLADPGADPDDPVHQRLFPSAVSGDDAADAELRAMLHDDLLRRRRAGLAALGELVQRGDRGRDGRVRVRLAGEDDAQLVLGVLNDIRLAIGARTGVAQVDRDELADDDPRRGPLEVMDYLGWMQEQLLELLIGRVEPPPS